MLRITFIISSLGYGGAENMLYKLIANMKIDYNMLKVISLKKGGVYESKLKDLGVQVISFDLGKRNFQKVLMIIKSLCEDADVISTWLYHADFIGFICGKLFMRKKLIWNIRHGNLGKDVNGTDLRLLFRINGILSRFVDKVTYNSEESIKAHKAVGYSDRNVVKVDNGFDTDLIDFNHDERYRMRSQMGFPDDERIFITVGRWDSQKDYKTLIGAVSKVGFSQLCRSYKVVFVGTGLEQTNKSLMDLISSYDLADSIILLGPRKDIVSLLSMSDFYISSSKGESFSNSIAEAMACGLTVIATNVGNSRELVSDTGFIITPENQDEMASAMKACLENDFIRFNREARQRIVNDYKIGDIAERYKNVLYD